MALQTFDHNISATVSVGSDLWVDLGAIPTGYAIWIGSEKLTSPSKTITCDLRPNTAGHNTGTTSTTVLLATTAVSPKSNTLLVDLYKNGSLHTVTVTGTGTEHWWLHLSSKTSTAGSFTYQIYYTLQ